VLYIDKCVITNIIIHSLALLMKNSQPNGHLISQTLEKWDKTNWQKIFAQQIHKTFKWKLDYRIRINNTKLTTTLLTILLPLNFDGRVSSIFQISSHNFKIWQSILLIRMHKSWMVKKLLMHKEFGFKLFQFILTWLS
jgi:hypothetical protein